MLPFSLLLTCVVAFPVERDTCSPGASGDIPFLCDLEHENCLKKTTHIMLPIAKPRRNVPTLAPTTTAIEGPPPPAPTTPSLLAVDPAKSIFVVQSLASSVLVVISLVLELLGGGLGEHGVPGPAVGAIVGSTVLLPQVAVMVASLAEKDCIRFGRLSSSNLLRHVCVASLESKQPKQPE